MESTSGAELASTLQRALDAMSAEVGEELARRGHPGATPAQHRAMAAIDGGAADAAALARALGVSRQAAAKTIHALEQHGYVTRGADAADGRRRPLEVTARGRERTRLGAEAYERIRRRIEERTGVERMRAADAVLRALADPPGPDDVGGRAD